MVTVKFSYGKSFIEHSFEDNRVNEVLTSKIHGYKTKKSGEELVFEALNNPINSQKLSELAVGKNKVVIIASDHTRPVPSKVIIPQMLKEIRKGNSEADIKILIATGFHRETTRAELVDKFGEYIVNNEKIIIHDSRDKDSLVHLGMLPSGGECLINRAVFETDLLVSEGFIEPHFFAGFSGGRKSVLPGIAGEETVLANHCSEFIADKNSRTGILSGNLLHRDMIWAAKKAKLSFIVNVVINEFKEAIFAVAGDMEKAHLVGCNFLSEFCEVKGKKADIVITTNGGYPLDQNIYQAVKGMTAAEAAVNKNGVIIMLAKSEDGHGGEELFKQHSDERGIDIVYDEFLKRERNETAPDQWEAQILIRILKYARVVYISDAPDEMIKSMRMIPAHSIDEAIMIADDILKSNPKITIIPDGVSVIVK